MPTEDLEVVGGISTVPDDEGNVSGKAPSAASSCMAVHD